MTPSTATKIFSVVVSVSQSTRSWVCRHENGSFTDDDDESTMDNGTFEGKGKIGGVGVSLLTFINTVDLFTFDFSCV